MKSLSSVIALSLLGLVSVAHAEEGYSYSDWARVTRVTPQYERINTPRRECKSRLFPVTNVSLNILPVITVRLAVCFNRWCCGWCCG